MSFQLYSIYIFFMYEYDNFSEIYYIKSFMIKFFLIKNKRTVVQVSDLTHWPFVKLRIERYSIKGKQRGLAVRVIFFPLFNIVFSPFD